MGIQLLFPAKLCKERSHVQATILKQTNIWDVWTCSAYVPVCICVIMTIQVEKSKRWERCWDTTETNEIISREKNRIQEGKRQIQVYFILMATAQFRRLHPDSMPTEAKATPPLREVLRRGHQRVPLLLILFRRL